MGAGDERIAVGLQRGQRPHHDRLDLAALAHRRGERLDPRLVDRPKALGDDDRVERNFPAQLNGGVVGHGRCRTLCLRGVAVSTGRRQPGFGMVDRSPIEPVPELVVPVRP